MLAKGEPLIRTKPKDLAAAGVERTGRVVGARDGLPVLEDGSVLDVANVIWSTGFSPGLSWIELPIMDGGYPRQDRGIVGEEPGLYFVGLKFLYAASSATLPGWVVTRPGSPTISQRASAQRGVVRKCER